MKYIAALHCNHKVLEAYLLKTYLTSFGYEMPLPTWWNPINIYQLHFIFHLICRNDVLWLLRIYNETSYKWCGSNFWKFRQSLHPSLDYDVAILNHNFYNVIIIKKWIACTFRMDAWLLKEYCILVMENVFMYLTFDKNIPNALKENMFSSLFSPYQWKWS